MTSAAEFRQSVTIPAVPEQVRVARAFVARALGKSRVDAELALLLASELVTNSVRHSGSAVPGGVVTVTVAAGDQAVRVEVTDRVEGPRSRRWPRLPVMRRRGAGVCGWWTRWLRGGYQRGGGLATTWFEQWLMVSGTTMPPVPFSREARRAR